MHMRRDALIIAAALSAALAIAAGAFGAHGASGKAADWLRIGGQYQLVHAAAALVLASKPAWRAPAWVVLGGAAVFALTLYLMAFGAPHWLGAVTPLGGVAMIVGWLWLAIKEARHSVERD